MAAATLPTTPDALFAFTASFSVAGALGADLVLNNQSIVLGGADGFTPAGPARAIRVGTAGSGHLKVQYASGVVDTIPACAANTLLSGKFVRVYATGTDVQDITVFW